jgi:cyclohexanone monooxygenase
MTEVHKGPMSLDVAIVGAGFSGLYMLYRLRKMGLHCRIFDSAGGVGGTWYWNRYPGCGSDIESLEYSYGFSDELQQDWKWSKRYPGQAEIEAYANHVADRFDLRRDIQLDTRVASVAWQENEQRWHLSLADGQLVVARFCVMATGLLSAPKPINIKGYESFSGEVLHTSRWPKEGADFAGKRVGIIGTGSSAVQSIPLIAPQADHLTVFQRTPNYSVPLHNGPLDPEYETRVKAMYPEWRQKQMNSFGGYVSVNFQPLEGNSRKAMESTPEEREAEYEMRWKSGGLCFYTSYADLLFDSEANKSLAEFFRAKIRPRIKDPELARKLIPSDYPILTKRLCADTNYYETFNRDNVTLVDVREVPITEITERGVRVGDVEHELDTLIFATGFDAVTGVLVNMDIRGRNGRTIREAWSDGPRTQAGLMTTGFPNMFMVNGPGSCTAFFNPILNVEYQGELFARMIELVDAKGFGSIDSTIEADDAWAKHMAEVAAPTLFWQSDNWFIGANIPGKPRVMMLYLGGFQAYKQFTTKLAAEDFPTFAFGKGGEAASGGQLLAAGRS